MREDQKQKPDGNGRSKPSPDMKQLWGYSAFLDAFVLNFIIK